MFFLRISLWKQIFAWFGPPPPDSDSSTRPPAHKERRMSTSTVALGTLLILAGTAQAGNPAAEPVDWLTWRHLPVLDGGRQKPLDSLAWETFRMIGNRASFVHPKTGDQLDATEAYLAMLLEWQGWDQPAPPMIDDSNPHAAYFTSHQPDGWDKMPLLLVDSAGLRQALGMPEHERFISPLELSHAKIVLESPSHGQSQDRDGDVARTPSAEATDSHRSGAQTTTPFLPWVQKVRAKQKGFSPQEKVAIELAERLWTYESTRMGLRLQLVPVEGSAQQQWASLADLFRAKLDDAQDPSGGLRKLQAQFQLLRKAYRGGDVPAFNAATADFLGTVRTIGPKLGAYPRQSDIDLEVSYNHWVPFRFAWVFTILACALGLLARGSRWRPLYAAALAAYGAAIVAMGIGFAMRVAISGRAPVTNMYESIIYVGLGVSLFGLLFELIYRKQFILIAAAAVATVALVLADNCPAVLDPSLQPLQPVLRSNYWLVIHVMTITLSYAAFALALGIADVTLGFYLFGAATRRESIAGLSQFNYKALQIGVLLLAAGVITGGIWAAYSWGRFWGWDPKEVWALIALLCYLAVLHARFARWIGDLGLAAWSVACFSAVVMAWYGVNFVLGSGLHSYGSGGGGKVYVLSAVLLQLLYVMAAVSMADRTPAKADAEDGPAGPKSTGGFRDLQAVSAADDVAP
jgi:cytochrome c-type biogenesis protein CcsB